MDFENVTFKELRDGLLKRRWSCQELVTHFLQRIDQGSHLNAFITVFERRAHQKAKAIDQKIKQGISGKLSGQILALKDNISLKGEKLTCGSRILSNFRSPYNATVVDKLEAEDAIIIGKTNMDEFAMGSSTESSYFGTTLNPRDHQRVSGGSSGGSCAAVAGGLVTAALGSDTGGSIRQPASFCGAVGLKPTYGRVSRFGLVAFASSLDQIGPIGRTVPEVAEILHVICGLDPRDSTSVPNDVPNFGESLERDVKGVRIGLPKEYFTGALDPEVRTILETVVTKLSADGAEFIYLSLPHTDYAIATYYILATAEASSNLARFDGARYGFRADDAKSLEESYVLSRNLGFGEEVKRRIMLGTYVLSAGYYDAYYLTAQKARTLILRDFEKVFETCDCLLTPTSPTPAFRIGEKLDDPLKMYLSDVYTVSVNLAGLPAISVPCGTDSKGLPVGAQIIGKHFDEATVLRVADSVEKNSE